VPGAVNGHERLRQRHVCVGVAPRFVWAPVCVVVDDGLVGVTGRYGAQLFLRKLRQSPAIDDVVENGVQGLEKIDPALAGV
jgi:hypothetical protein